MTDEAPALRRHMAAVGDLIGRAARPVLVERHLMEATARMRSLFGAAACSCALVEPGGDAIRFVAADGAGSDVIVGTVMGTDRGIAGWVATTGQAIVVADVRKDPRFARDVAEETRYVPTSIMAAPLLTREGDVLGVVEVLDRTAAGEGTGRDLDVLALLGAELAAVVGLAAVTDRLGSVLVPAVRGGADADDFDATLTAGAGDDDLGTLARTVVELSALGPRGRTLAREVLDAVLTFARSGRR